MRLRFMGRECDLPKMDPCAANGEFGFNDDPGYIDIPLVEGPFSATSENGTGRCGCFTIDGTMTRSQR